MVKSNTGSRVCKRFLSAKEEKRSVNLSTVVSFTVAVSSELNNAASNYVERGEFLERRTDFWIFKKCCTP